MLGIFGVNKPSEDDICRFFRAVRRYRNGGIQTVQALEYYKDDCEHPVMAAILATLIRDMQNGLTFSDALKKHTVFPTFISQLIKVGEDTGELSRIMDEVVFYLEQNAMIKKDLKSDLFTVKLFVGGALIALALAIFMVIPMMSEILMELDAELPFISTVFINIGMALKNAWPLFLLLVVVIYYGYKYMKNTHKEKMDRYKLKVPFYAKLHYCELQYRLTKILSLITYGNIPITNSLRLLANSVDHIPLQKVLLASVSDIQNSGMSGVEALEKNNKQEKIIAKDVLLVLRAAERTNSIPNVMNELSDDYRKDLGRISKGLPTKVSLSIVIPMLVVLILLLISVYAPILNLMSAATSKMGM